MAIDQGTAQVNIQTTDRTWRIEMFVDDTDVVQLRFHREVRKKDVATGKFTSDKNMIPVVVREQALISAKTYTAGGLTATGLQILQLANKMSDTERQVDIDAGG